MAMTKTLSEVTQVDGQPWTVWTYLRPDVLGPVAVCAAPGREPEIPRPLIDVHLQHHQITSREHDATCRWGICSPCTCAPAIGDPQPLYAAALRLITERHAYLDQVEKQQTRRQHEVEDAETAWPREPGRIIVGGSDAGWRLWQPRRHGWYNTGEVVAPCGPITDHDPRLVAVWDDVIGLYSIRDPRTQEAAR